MKWSNVKLILGREIRDQLRDRRTLFTVAVLPLVLYPLLGLIFLQAGQFAGGRVVRIRVIGAGELPSEPRLIHSGRFAPEMFAGAKEAKLMELAIDKAPPHKTLPHKAVGDDPARAAADAIESDSYDAVVYFPPGFADQLRRYRKRFSADSGPPARGDIPGPEIFFDETKDRSRLARDRLSSVFRRWHDEIVRRNLRQSEVPPAATRPFELKRHNLAPATRPPAIVWSKILPFVMLIWALTGAFYPAVDLCAGEKERGTLETLLSSPARRSEIVWGKLLAIMIFSMATSVLNLASTVLTGAVVVGRMQSAGAAAGFAVGLPPVLSVGWLLLALVPVAALFSALSLAVAAMARSTKEGQYYLMPLMMISMPLMVLPMLPTAKLNLGTSLIPISGVLLLLKGLVEGRYLDTLRYVAPVAGVTAICCYLATRWAIRQFNNESVLFRESERLDLRLWLRHVVRDRGATPGLAAAVACGVLLLVLRFFTVLLMPAPGSWNQLAGETLLGLVVLIAGPALLMTFLLARSPRRTLLLRAPRWSAVPAAALLAIALHPVAVAMSRVIQTLYPLGGDAAERLQQVGRLVDQAPSLWYVLAVLAVAPAVCEELVFRGFILSGLRHMGHRWGAILTSALVFGAAHGMLQQSISAFALGIVLGYLAVQTGSLLPCILFHLTHNALLLVLGSVADGAPADRPGLGWLFQWTGDDYTYRWPVVAVGGAIAAALLLWFGRLPCENSEEEKLQQILDRPATRATVKL